MTDPQGGLFIGKKAIDYALFLLSFRDRSEGEIRKRLEERFPKGEVDEAVKRLKELSLINDLSFASNFIKGRKKGKILLLKELLRKGVSREDAERVLSELDELPISIEAGRKKALSLRGLLYKDFRAKLYRYLKMRGFSQDVIEEATRRLWEEVKR